MQEGSCARLEVAVLEMKTHPRDLAVPGCKSSWGAPSDFAVRMVVGCAHQPADPAVLSSGFKVSSRKTSAPGNGWSPGVWKETLLCL